MLFKKGCNFLLGRTICRLYLILLWCNVISQMYKNRFKGVGSFEDDLYSCMSKDSSQSLTKLPWMLVDWYFSEHGLFYHVRWYRLVCLIHNTVYDVRQISWFSTTIYVALMEIFKGFICLLFSTAESPLAVLYQSPCCSHWHHLHHQHHCGQMLMKYKFWSEELQL